MAEIPVQQQAAVVENPGAGFQVRIRTDIPVSQPNREEVLVKVGCSGLW